MSFILWFVAIFLFLSALVGIWIVYWIWYISNKNRKHYNDVMARFSR